MEKRAQLPDDPFYISGERWVYRGMLKNAMGDLSDNGNRIEDVATPMGIWETSAGGDGVKDTRLDNFQRVWTHGFHQRLGLAAVGAAFLIAPMWLMVLHNTLYTALVSTTVFVAVFGLISARFLTSLMEVVSATAAYAAVLVVFVGLITDESRRGA